MINNICTVFLPISYSRGCYHLQSSHYYDYAKQKIALELEREICENSINCFVINLFGLPALDAADAMLNLREKYSFIELDFIENCSQLFINNKSYNQKHDFLLSNADKKISAKQLQSFNKKYLKYFACPPYYAYAFSMANRILVYKVSPLLSRLADIAYLHDIKVDSFELQTFTD